MKKGKNIKPPKKGDNKKYKSKGIRNLLLALAVAAIAKVGYDTGLTLLEDIDEKKLGVAVDNPDDNFDECIPIYSDSLLIGTIEDGSFLLVNSYNSLDGKAQVTGISDTGDIITGIIDDDYFQIQENISNEILEEYSQHIYEVTNADIVNIREDNSLGDDSIIGEVYEGMFLLGKEPIESSENDLLWAPILYWNGEEFVTAYICYDYVQEINQEAAAKENKLSDQEIEAIIQNARVNENGKVVGIDISATDPEDLRMMLTNENAIPSVGIYDHNDMYLEYDMSDLAGKIDFVYLCLGARGYGDEGNLVEFNDRIKELAEVCEETGTPFGYYYFGQAKSNEEADEELSTIQDYLEIIGNCKYNVLPFAYDYEIFKSDGRLDGFDGTEVVAHFINEATTELGPIILYVDPNDIAGKGLLDLEELNILIDYDNPICTWLVASRYTQSNNVSRQEYINEVAENSFILMVQSIQDVTGEGIPNIDIDIVGKDSFELLIKGELYKEKEDKTEEIERD